MAIVTVILRNADRMSSHKFLEFFLGFNDFNRGKSLVEIDIAKPRKVISKYGDSLVLLLSQTSFELSNEDWSWSTETHFPGFVAILMGLTSVLDRHAFLVLAPYWHPVQKGETLANNFGISPRSGSLRAGKLVWISGNVIRGALLWDPQISNDERKFPLLVQSQQWVGIGYNVVQIDTGYIQPRNDWYQDIEDMVG